MSKESVAVRIAGHNYKILSDGDADSLRQIASYVDRAMNRVRERTGTVDTLDISVLTCINLAREVLALREQQNLVGDDRMRSLIERVETVLVGETPSQAADAAEDIVPEDSKPVRTLDLPSVEALRDRTTASSGESGAGSAEESMPEARVASGGRERAS
jgi:cell division protein ZapA (FtsZ GTPase activity inhibitor)